MFDRRVRPILDPALDRIARTADKAGLTPNTMTLLGMGCGIACALAISGGLLPWAALTFMGLSRLADGLDGPLARLQGSNSDFGGFLDIVCDFVFYVGVPLGFAMLGPNHALAAAFLLGGFLLTGVSHLAFAVHAHKRGLTDGGQDNKSFFFADGLAEGTETIIIFAAMICLPQYFVPLAYGYAFWCVLSALGRVYAAWKTFS